MSCMPLETKKNTSKHRKWAEVLRNYQSQVKQMIVDAEEEERKKDEG